MARRVVFIESNTSGTGRFFAMAARDLGLVPIVFAKDPARYEYLASDDIEHVTVNTDDDDALHSALVSRMGAGDPLGITSSSEYYIAAAARLAAKLGLPAPSSVAVEQCRYKPRQRELLRGGGVRCPAGRVARSAEGCLAAAGEVGYPVVLKPPDRSGSEGVRQCASPAEVFEHGGVLLAAQDRRGVSASHRAVLVESFVEGPEYSVEIFAGSVVGITRKHLSALPHFVEIGHDFPAVLAAAEAERIGLTALAAAEILGIAEWISHVELRVTAAGPVVIEVNPRLAGGFIPELIRLAKGVDLIRAAICRSSGISHSVSSRTVERHAAIRFLLPSHAGVLRSVSGIEAATSITGIAEVKIYRRVGDPVGLQGDFRDRIGHVIACGDRAEASGTAAVAALREIRVTLEEAKSGE